MARLSNTHFERAPNHVAPIELNIDCVNAVLMRDEANSILIWKEKRHKVNVGGKQPGVK